MPRSRSIECLLLVPCLQSLLQCLALRLHLRHDLANEVALERCAQTNAGVASHEALSFCQNVVVRPHDEEAVMPRVGVKIERDLDVWLLTMLPCACLLIQTQGRRHR